MLVYLTQGKSQLPDPGILYLYSSFRSIVDSRNNCLRANCPWLIPQGDILQGKYPMEY